MTTIGVVGGGAAGLGAAWTALEAGANVVLFDRNADLGGRCRTHEWCGEWLIRGAAAFIGGEQEIVDMCKAVGVYKAANIMSSQEEMEFTVVHPKQGFAYLGGFDVPSILKSTVIPLAEKAKLAATLPKMLEAFVHASDDDPTSVLAMDDVNACEYFRRYSPSFVDYILEPIMNMYCGYGEADYSMAWLGWLMASPRSWSASQWTFADRGVGKLTQALQAKLAAHPRCELNLDVEVTQVRTRSVKPEISYRSNGSVAVQSVDKVVVAVPGSFTSSIMPDLPAEHGRFFKQVEYLPHHIVHMIIDQPKEEIPFSLLLPTCEGFDGSSNVWLKPFAADPGKTLFYGEVKGKFARENVGKDDEFFIKAVWKDACRALPPLRDCATHQWHVQRNEIGLCSRRKGYTTALREFRGLAPIDNVSFAGDYLINSTVGQSMRSGIAAAKQVLND